MPTVEQQINAMGKAIQQQLVDRLLECDNCGCGWFKTFQLGRVRMSHVRFKTAHDLYDPVTVFECGKCGVLHTAEVPPMQTMDKDKEYKALLEELERLNQANPQYKGKQEPVAGVPVESI